MTRKVQIHYGNPAVKRRSSVSVQPVAAGAAPSFQPFVKKLKGRPVKPASPFHTKSLGDGKPREEAPSLFGEPALWTPRAKLPPPRKLTLYDRLCLVLYELLVRITWKHFCAVVIGCAAALVVLILWKAS